MPTRFRFRRAATFGPTCAAWRRRPAAMRSPTDWERESDSLSSPEAATRPLRPISVTRHAERTSETPRVVTGAATRGRAFGLLVHQHPRMDPVRRRCGRPRDHGGEPGAAVRPLDRSAAAQSCTQHVQRVDGSCPVIDRARAAARLWRELSLWFPEGDQLLEGKIDLVFEEDGTTRGSRLQDGRDLGGPAAPAGRSSRATAPALRARPDSSVGPEGSRAIGGVHGARQSRPRLRRSVPPLPVGERAGVRGDCRSSPAFSVSPCLRGPPDSRGPGAAEAHATLAAVEEKRSAFSWSVSRHDAFARAAADATTTRTTGHAKTPRSSA